MWVNGRSVVVVTDETQHGPPARAYERRGAMEEREAQRLHGREAWQRGVLARAATSLGAGIDLEVRQ